MVGTLPGFSRAANMRAFVLLVLGFAAVAGTVTIFITYTIH